VLIEFPPRFLHLALQLLDLDQMFRIEGSEGNSNRFHACRSNRPRLVSAALFIAGTAKAPESSSHDRGGFDWRQVLAGRQRAFIVNHGARRPA